MLVCALYLCLYPFKVQVCHTGHTHTSSPERIFNDPVGGCKSTDFSLSLAIKGARCSSVVRAFAHGAMGRPIDPSW